jgi:hypothetical protein
VILELFDQYLRRFLPGFEAQFQRLQAAGEQETFKRCEDGAEGVLEMFQALADCRIGSRDQTGQVKWSSLHLALLTTTEQNRTKV